MTATPTIEELPRAIHQKILSFLTYAEISSLGKVSQQFCALCKDYTRLGIRKLLVNVRKKLNAVVECMNSDRFVEEEKKVQLNQTYTALEMISIDVFALYVKHRHVVGDLYAYPLLGKFLDDMNYYMKEIDITRFALWLEQCVHLQSILTKFNLQNISRSQQNFDLPLGIHFMDLLDLLIGVNYELTCTYNLDENTCRITGKYYTHNIKFLSYLPDLMYLNDCTDRQINLVEGESILKYLGFLVNMHNCMYCKGQEYRREMEIYGGNLRFETSLPSALRRRCCSRSIGGSNVVEKYERILEEVSDRTLKDILNCQIVLNCSLSQAPYQVMTSYETLQSDLILESDHRLKIPQNHSDGLILVRDDLNDISSYGVKVRLQLDIHKKLDTYEVVFTDGNEM